MKLEPFEAWAIVYADSTTAPFVCGGIQKQIFATEHDAHEGRKVFYHQGFKGALSIARVRVEECGDAN